jgi:osmotically-inducible protein OsmY
VYHLPNEEFAMAMRDMFRGRQGRDRSHDRWRENWRDDQYPQRYSSGSDFETRSDRDYGASDYSRGREPQFYGQSGRSDWANQGPGQNQADEWQRRDWDRQHWIGGSGERQYGGQQNYGGRYGRDYEHDVGSFRGGYGTSGRDTGGFYSGGTPRGASSSSWGEDDMSYWRSGQFPQGSQFPRGSMSASDQSRYESEGQHRGRGPRGYQRSDQRIHEEVCECLTDDSYVDASNIDVKVNSAEVTLSGTVNSRDEKRRAEDIIEDLSGVRDVHNSLRVVNEGGQIEGASTRPSEPAAQSNTQTQRAGPNQAPRH